MLQSSVHGCIHSVSRKALPAHEALLQTLVAIFARQSAHQLTNNAQHDFVGTAADGDQAHVAVGTGQGVFPHVAVAAPVLQAGVGDFTAQTAGFELGHGGEFGHVFTGNVQFTGLVVRARRASTSVCSSARRKWMYWLLISGWPKVLRSRQYSMVWSMQFSSALITFAAPHMRSSWNWIIWHMKPVPSEIGRASCRERVYIWVVAR